MKPTTLKIDDVEYVRKDTAQISNSPIKIVVLDRGFVYIGHADVDANFVTITGAHNVRVWGTSKGLGQLANEGPLANTKLDVVGTVRAPVRALISLIDVDASKWTSL